MNKRLTREFYTESDAIKIAKKLIGKKLVTKINGELTSGIITETEAYMGEEDQACHVFGGKRTERTKVLYEKGGKAYVYFSYGLHYLLNITVGEQNDPQCVLIRSIYPKDGIEIMRWRRTGHIEEGENQDPPEKLANGPAKLTQALAIDKSLYGLSLLSRRIWIEEGIKIPPKEILATPRIGIDYAGTFKDKPWRFVVENGKVGEMQ